MIFPYRTKNPPESLPAATIGLIAVNLIIYGLTSNGLVVRESVVEQFALTRANVSPLTLFSSMFLHGDIFHILGNMWFLWLLGAAVEGRLKTLKFLAVYFASGLAGDGLHLLMTMSQRDLPSLGASGAIMGLLGAAIWMFPHSKVCVAYYFSLWWYGVWEWRMWGIALYYLGFDVLDLLLSRGQDGIAHFAHLGGALGGFVAVLLLRAKRDDVVISDAKSELADSSDLRSLTKYELAQLARAQPDNPDVALAWVGRCLTYGGAAEPEAIDHFCNHARHLAREGDIDQVGAAMFALSEIPGRIPAHLLLDAAIRLEREGRPQFALPLLERVLKAPDCNDSLAEGAVFRLGMINEAWYQNHHKALEWFQEHQRRWPFSAMEGQVKDRIAVLSAKV